MKQYKKIFKQNGRAKAQSAPSEHTRRHTILAVTWSHSCRFFFVSPVMFCTVKTSSKHTKQNESRVAPVPWGQGRGTSWWPSGQSHPPWSMDTCMISSCLYRRQQLMILKDVVNGQDPKGRGSRWDFVRAQQKTAKRGKWNKMEVREQRKLGGHCGLHSRNSFAYVTKGVTDKANDQPFFNRKTFLMIFLKLAKAKKSFCLNHCI